jgi:hypothetical protein
VLSKPLERLAARQLTEYLIFADLQILQSGYPLGHYSETAKLKVISDILQAVEHKNIKMS